MKIVGILFSLYILGNISAQDYISNQKYYPYKDDNKWGYINSFGQRVIEPQFDEAYPFFCELALVKKAGSYGFINSTAVTIIDFKYDNANSFKNGYAWVKKNGREALIRKDGSVFLDYWFIKISQFNDGYAKVIFENDSITNQLDDKYIVAYVNKEEKQLTRAWFSGGTDFRNGIAKVNISGEYFLLDTLGNIEYRDCEECEQAVPYDPEMKIDRAPEFPGGEFALEKFISNNIKYPLKALKRGVQGIVYLKFAVNKRGEVTHVSVYRSVHPLLDKEAIRVLERLPRWKPAKKGGAPVCYWAIIPFHFSIEPRNDVKHNEQQLSGKVYGGVRSIRH